MTSRGSRLRRSSGSDGDYRRLSAAIGVARFWDSTSIGCSRQFLTVFQIAHSLGDSHTVRCSSVSRRHFFAEILAGRPLHGSVDGMEFHGIRKGKSSAYTRADRDEAPILKSRTGCIRSLTGTACTLLSIRAESSRSGLTTMARQIPQIAGSPEGHVMFGGWNRALQCQAERGKTGFRMPGLLARKQWDQHCRRREEAQRSSLRSRPCAEAPQPGAAPSGSRASFRQR